MRTCKHIATLLASLFIAFASVAQDEDQPALNPERMKELKAQKTAYLTTKLGLTTEEAQRFWPIYNAFDEAREGLRKQLRDMYRSARDGQGALSESTARELLSKSLDLREREVKLERDYSERFAQAIGAVKTIELLKAERDFNREVLRRLRDRMEERRDERPRPGGRMR